MLVILVHEGEEPVLAHHPGHLSFSVIRVTGLQFEEVLWTVTFTP